MKLASPTPERFAQAVGHAIQHAPDMDTETTRPRLPYKPKPNFDTLNTGDPVMQQAIARARRLLGRDIPLIVQGESGVGKELFAQAFHHESPRASGPFIALNCAAIPENLIEAELFGYAGGAVTGARKDGAMGKIQQAHGGTLFLDEIGDMPLALQSRLLRVLQERIVTPLGGHREFAVDIALVCATHRKLRDEVAAGRFREDLYYRLNGLSLTLPALRDRQDLGFLIHQLICDETEAFDFSTPVGISDAAMATLLAYHWPGNLRQLSNVIRLACVLLEDGERQIDVGHLPEEVFERPAPSPAMAKPAADGLAFMPVNGKNLKEIGDLAAQQALASVSGNISAAARLLGVSRNTLYRKLGRL
ncbi:MAG: sigma 54-interacting transcriptional regulator [Azonexus sp.]|nr:sigma 54-interacting transcriptional regulator [Azonexus sp.]